MASKAPNIEIRLELTCLGNPMSLITTDLEFETDPSTSFGRLPVAMFENCSSSSPFATAMLVVAASLLKKWPWIKVLRIKKGDVIVLQIPSDKETSFRELYTKGKIYGHLKDDFEDLKCTAEGILGEEIHSKFGDTVLAKVKNVRVAAVKTVPGCDGGDVINMDIKGGGKAKIMQQDHINFAKGDEGPGTTANIRVRGNSETHVNQKGCINIAGKPSAKDLEDLAKLKAGRGTPSA